MTPPKPAPRRAKDDAPRNLLGGETSPYLLQHKENPVHWRPWGEAAFAEARASGKPVLLSVGYAACHWCHVMAHESFEDKDVAALMNRLFVNIKVDREERPDIDSIYQHALQLLGEHGGWPLTMFLTPEGEPFWGGTYFPKESRYGRPGFAYVLERIAEIYRDEPNKVRESAASIKSALGQLVQSERGGLVPLGVLDQIANEILKLVDGVHGGIGGAPKFPQVPMFELLWRAWKRMGRMAFRDAVTLTLERMCQGGIYDHLGGGFARYSVDAAWLVPHFEKMLYDNAQLVDLMTLVWQETRSPLLAARIEETIGWLLREMTVDGGGFAGTLDADSEGEEGKFYVWREPEIDEVLCEAAPAFKTAYDVTPDGNWEGKTILNRSQRPELGDTAAEASLAAARAKLLARRARRVRPGLDDKVLADWNGLAIVALAHAGLAFGRSDWIDAGAKAFRSVCDRMIVDGRLRHSWRAGIAAHPANLDDYANMCNAALAMHEATSDAAYLAQAEAWLGTIEVHFAHPDGGYCFAADDVGDVLVRQKTAFDHATPAGNAVLAQVLARLYYVTGHEDCRIRAERLIGAFTGALQRQFHSLTSLLNACEFLQDALQIVLCGDKTMNDFNSLKKTVLQRSLPNRVLVQLSPGMDLPDGHPAAGKGAIDGRATAYVCRGPVCSLPITETGALAEELDRAIKAKAL
jgi:uncharacterized protein YyaL (SSP411 family)